MKTTQNAIDKLGDSYRFSPKDADTGWAIVCRYFGSREDVVSDEQWELAEWCLKAESLHEQSGKWPTVAEVRHALAK